MALTMVGVMLHPIIPGTLAGIIPGTPVGAGTVLGAGIRPGIMVTTGVGTMVTTVPTGITLAGVLMDYGAMTMDGITMATTMVGTMLIAMITQGTGAPVACSRVVTALALPPTATPAVVWMHWEATAAVSRHEAPPAPVVQA